MQIILICGCPPHPHPPPWFNAIWAPFTICIHAHLGGAWGGRKGTLDAVLYLRGLGQEDAQRAVCTKNLICHVMKPWLEKQPDGYWLMGPTGRSVCPCVQKESPPRSANLNSFPWNCKNKLWINSTLIEEGMASPMCRGLVQYSTVHRERIVSQRSSS